MLKISLKEESGLIKRIHIAGDFFMHPEETIEKLENFLEGVVLKEESLEAAFAGFLLAEEVQIYGFEAEDLVQSILKCL